MLRVLVALIVGVIIGVAAYNYWSGRGLTLRPPSSVGELDRDAARQRGRDLSEDAAARAQEAIATIESAVGQGALTAKIKAKMALDDYVNSRAINVDTSGTVVTLTGVVSSEAERDRAVRLARETHGVTEVIDKLEVRAR